MPLDRLIISNIKTGFETDLEPFNIGNDAFPVLNNAYTFRGRVKRKRGTKTLGRLKRILTSFSAGNYSTINGTNTLNILTAAGISSTQPSASIVPFTASISGIVITFAAPISQTLTDATGTGILVVGGGAGPIVSATINYSTSVVTITSNAALGPAAATFTTSYYPVLPGLGFKDFDIGTVNQQLPVSFDTRYSYQLNQGTNLFYDTTFYKNTAVAFNFNGENYQQFYTTNYLGDNTIVDIPDKVGCLWTTNGKPGFHYKNITAVPVVGASTQLTIVAHGLTTSDYIYVNEVGGVSNLNGFSGLVTSVIDANNITIDTSANATAGAYTSGGIAQYLTRSVSSTADGIRWYDGDPTISPNFGWVNFAPPLDPYSADNLHPLYLVGATSIVSFKNRLLFSGVYLTTTALGATIQYYPNRVVYSQVGSPYYSKPLPYSIRTQQPDSAAWYEHVAGRGGFITSPVDQEIVTVDKNNDVLIYGMENSKMRLVYTLDDSFPFIFQIINSELGSQSTFASVSLDNGVISIGNYGITMTSQTSCKRIDLLIPDQVFDFSISNNNSQRVTAVRDYENEWIYFSYCPGERTNNVFNSKTLLYNYRDNSWATFDENYTAYGTFRRSTNRTWASLKGLSWATWRDPWNSNSNQAYFPQIVGMNQHGFVMIREDENTEEDYSQMITAVNTATYTITSPNHCLNNADFIKINSLLGITFLDVNGAPIDLSVFQITRIDANNFIIDCPTDFTISGSYLGTGIYKRFSRPFIQTKQFAPYWGAGRQVRLGTQRMLFQTTASGELTSNVYCSQNPDSPSNDPSANAYLSFSNVVLTRPEPYNPYSAGQNQIWHRQSNSFVGDSVQLAFTLNNSQMFDESINTQEIELHAIVLDLYPGGTISG